MLDLFVSFVIMQHTRKFLHFSTCLLTITSTRTNTHYNRRKSKQINVFVFHCFSLEDHLELEVLWGASKSPKRAERRSVVGP